MSSDTTVFFCCGLSRFADRCDRDRARIGWLPLEQWQDVTPGEIDACRLPGEKGYEEPKRAKSQSKEGWWREWL